MRVIPLLQSLQSLRGWFLTSRRYVDDEAGRDFAVLRRAVPGSSPIVAATINHPLPQVVLTSPLPSAICSKCYKAETCEAEVCDLHKLIHRKCGRRFVSVTDFASRRRLNFVLFIPLSHQFIRATEHRTWPGAFSLTD